MIPDKTGANAGRHIKPRPSEGGEPAARPDRRATYLEMGRWNLRGQAPLPQGSPTIGPWSTKVRL
jgi:hypothetical protein